MYNAISYCYIFFYSVSSTTWGRVVHTTLPQFVLEIQGS
jgi:hypothetical protein